MPIKKSGFPLAFSEIEAEFGKCGAGRTLGGYRISETYGDYTTSLDEGIPSSGPIKFSDFYDKRLNIIVDFYSPSGAPVSGGLTTDAYTRVNAHEKYKTGIGVSVVGSKTFLPAGGSSVTKPDDTSGKKVVVHVNQKIGSAKVDQFTSIGINRCALRTGAKWNNNTVLQVDVGTSGEIYGAGGNGGRNINGDTVIPGFPGTSAIGFEYSGKLINRGYIQCGFGGGGGGGNCQVNPDPNPQDHASSGGGGGGGAGFPVGLGGGPGTGKFGNGQNGASGKNATERIKGEGGAGGKGQGAFGGDGGDGGGFIVHNGVTTTEISLILNKTNSQNARSLNYFINQVITQKNNPNAIGVAKTTAGLASNRLRIRSGHPRDSKSGKYSRKGNYVFLVNHQGTFNTTDILKVNGIEVAGTTPALVRGALGATGGDKGMGPVVVPHITKENFGGLAGGNGAAIRVNKGITVTIENQGNGVIHGDQNANGVN